MPAVEMLLEIPPCAAGPRVAQRSALLAFPAILKKEASSEKRHIIYPRPSRVVLLALIALVVARVAF
jgi:hypothetical protein